VPSGRKLGNRVRRGGPPEVISGKRPASEPAHRLRTRYSHGGLLTIHGAMTSNDVTVVIPRQPGSEVREFDPADPWEAPTGPDAQAVADARSRALSTVAWMIPTLAMGVIGFIGLDRPGLWGDELITWGYAVTPWSEFLPLLRNAEAVLGPFYALMRAWVELAGDSDFALRAPSVVFMAAAAGLVARVATHVAAPSTGLVAGLLFTLLPATTRYAQEARPYALAVFAAALATWLLVRALDRPTVGRWLPYALAVWLLGLAHAVALTLVIAHGAAILAIRRKATLGWLVSAVVGVLPGGLLLWVGASQRAQIAWIPPASLDRLAALPESLFGGTLIGGIMIALALMGLALERRLALVTVWALLPVGLLFVAGHFTSIFLYRYLLFTVPAWVILAAVALTRSPIMRALAALAIVATLAFPSHAELRQTGGHGQDSKALAATLTAHATPADGVLFGPRTGGEAIVGRDLVAHYVPLDRRPADVLAQRPPRTNGSTMPAECPDVAACLSGVERLWIVRTVATDDPLAGITDAIRNVVDERYEIAETWRFRGLTLALAVRKTVDDPAVTG
jgi:mannosyltransferase